MTTSLPYSEEALTSNSTMEAPSISADAIDFNYTGSIMRSHDLGMGMEMSDADMMVDMQMAIGTKFTINHFLFDSWKADTETKFCLILLFIFVCCVTTEWLVFIK